MSCFARWSPKRLIQAIIRRRCRCTTCILTGGLSDMGHFPSHLGCLSILPILCWSGLKPQATVIATKRYSPIISQMYYDLTIFNMIWESWWSLFWRILFMRLTIVVCCWGGIPPSLQCRTPSHRNNPSFLMETNAVFWSKVFPKHSIRDRQLADIYSINNMIGALANTPKWKEADGSAAGEPTSMVYHRSLKPL